MRPNCARQTESLQNTCTHFHLLRLVSLGSRVVSQDREIACEINSEGVPQSVRPQRSQEFVADQPISMPSRSRTRANAAASTQPSAEYLAAVKLQKAYRLIRTTYMKYGPAIFCRSRTQHSPHGRLQFSRGVGKARSAAWMCVSMA